MKKQTETKQAKKPITKECALCSKVFISLSADDIDKQYNAHYFFKHRNGGKDE